jgi:hypothetical protein
MTPRIFMIALRILFHYVTTIAPPTKNDGKNYLFLVGSEVVTAVIVKGTVGLYNPEGHTRL